MTPEVTFREALHQRAIAAGFCAVGIAPAQAEDAHRRRLERWLSAGMHGEMGYMARPNIDRSNAETVLPGAKSVIVLAASYAPPGAPPQHEPEPGLVRIARYALGKDYHEVFRRRLAQVETWLRETIPGHEWRIITDSAPLLERAFAEAGGLGFIGRNAMLITPHAGSFVLLAEIVTTALLSRDRPHPGTCGTCTRCIVACPTQAITAEGVVDARLCISYTTIERRSPPSPAEHAAAVPWAFGCDICQDVCPYNNHPKCESMEELREGTILNAVEPASTFLAPESNSQFERRFAESPVLRPGRTRVQRNVNWAAGLEKLPVKE